MFKTGLVALTATAAVALSGFIANADAATTVPPFHISYTINSLYPVTNIAMLEEIVGSSYGATESFSAPAGTTTLTDPFEKTAQIGDTFLAGVATNLPGDPPGQQHAVLFTNDTFAANAQGIAFGTLFPNTDEDTLIAALENGGPPATPNVFDVINFANGDASGGPNGNLAFTPGDTFTEIAFSSGQIIGTGISFETPDGGPVSAAPEPSTWLLMFAGLGGVGLMLRRAKKAADFRFRDAFSA